MPAGDRWRLPDGRDAIEAGRSLRLLRVLPVLSGSPFLGEPLLVWRADCIKQPSRYLGGAVPAEPLNEPINTPNLHG